MITSYNELPYEVYFKILDIKKEGGTDADAQIVALLAGRTLEEIMTIPLTEYFALKEKAAFLYFQPKVEPVRKSVYEIGGYRLVPVSDIRKIQTAQYTDWQEYLKMEDNKAGLLSCFLVPEGKAYNEGYDIFDVQKAIRDSLSIMDYLDLLDFFQTRLVKSMRVSLTCSIKEARRIPNRKARRQTRQTLRLLRRSLPNGTGSRRWTMFLRLPALILNRSIDCPSSSF